MSKERQRVIGLIAAEFSPEVQSDAIRHLWKPYEMAYSASRDFDAAQARKVYGHHRLALMEQSFKTFCAKHPGITAEDQRRDGSSYDYFTMRTDSLLITVKSIRGPNLLPPWSIFRDTLASGTQLDAFKDVETVDGRQYFHVLLLHGCERQLIYDEETKLVRKVKIRSRPGFAELAVPERDGKECILRLPLFSLHAALVAELRGVAPADVPGTGKRIRPKKKDDVRESRAD